MYTMQLLCRKSTRSSVSKDAPQCVTHGRHARCTRAAACPQYQGRAPELDLENCRKPFRCNAISVAATEFALTSVAFVPNAWIQRMVRFGVLEAYQTLVGCVLPFVLFRALERLPGQDAVSAGRWTVAGITVLTVGWVATYLTRVGTKRTTYAQQLRAYEDAVLRRRLAELSDEELQVLLADGDDGESTGPERSFESGAASSSLSKSPEEPDRRK